MPLTLVLGPANSAKAGEVLGTYAAAANRGALLVVPTALDAGHYARELAQDGSTLGSVLTFSGLAAEIARRAGYDARRLTGVQRERVLRRAVRSAHLEVLGSSAGGRGFVGAAEELVAELERSLVTPQRFAQALRSWSSGDRRRESYASEVASIYGGYRRQLDRIGRVDDELYAWRALDALRAAPGRWGADSVFFYGFDDLHPLERDAVETLARAVGVEVTVSLTYEAGRAAMRTRAELVEELRALADRVLELPPIDEYYAPASRVALHHLERASFEPGSERIDPGPAVRLLESGGARAEAELVAAEVLALLRAGVVPREIAVVYRSLAGAAPVIRRVFHQYGIATTIDRSVPFAHTALGRGVLALARCAGLGGHQASARDLLDYVRSPGLLDGPEIADQLELEVRRKGPRSIAQGRERLGITLEEIDALRSAADQAAELGRQARRLLAAPHRGAAPSLGGDEELDARALATMLRALEQLKELGERLAGGELIELLEGLEVQVGGTAHDGAVLVADPLSIRARRFRAVFVCGLEEGAFPRSGAPEPFLSDERRLELAACSGLRLRLSEDALARERYLFYATVSRATDQVVLSYRSSDEEGNLELPSPFIADVSELLVEDWPSRRRRRLLADVVWTDEDAPSARELARARAAAGAPPAGEIVSGIAPLSARAMGHVRHQEIVSAGALEAYADCPVKWLVERELRPARLEPEPDPLARGSYMHDALEQVLRRLGKAVTPASLPEALRVLHEVVSELSPGLAPGRAEGLRRALAAAIEADLRRYLEHEAEDGCEWEPQQLELRFGFEDEEGSLPAVLLGEGGGRALLRGAIDRVDVDPSSTRAIVRDYKSGPLRPEHQGARWRTDRQLQVALYMRAVSDLLGLEPVAGLYQPLGGSDLRARGMFLKEATIGSRLVANDGREQSELQAALDEAAARAVELASRLRAGELHPCPQTCSRDGCRYPGICRSG